MVKLHEMLWHHSRFVIKHSDLVICGQKNTPDFHWGYRTSYLVFLRSHPHVNRELLSITIAIWIVTGTMRPHRSHLRTVASFATVTLP